MRAPPPCADRARMCGDGGGERASRQRLTPYTQQRVVTGGAGQGRGGEVCTLMSRLASPLLAANSACVHIHHTAPGRDVNVKE